MSEVDQEAVHAAVRSLLTAIGEDPDRDGLKDTPARVARFWRDFIDYDPGTVDTVFKSIDSDQLVVVQGMRVYSVCEHHLLPFSCDISVGYLANDHVLGLSKIARIAHKHAHQLQLQERLVHGIAKDVEKMVKSPDVAVVASGEHSCMTMRGIRTPHRMKSSITLGKFREAADLRREFFQVLGHV